MEGCSFWSFKNSDTIQCHNKGGKSKDIIYYNFDSVRLKEERHIHLEWLEDEYF